MSEKTNIDFLAFDVRAEGSHQWYYFIDKSVTGPVQSKDEMVALASTLFGVWQEIAEPTKLQIEYEYHDSGWGERRNTSAEVVEDPSGIDEDAFVSVISRLSNDGDQLYIRQIDFGLGVWLSLADGDVFASRYNNDYCKRVSGTEILDSDVTDPLRIRIQQIQPDYVGSLEHFDQHDELYMIKITSTVEIWFDDTEFGHDNRKRLHTLLTAVSDAFDVKETRIRSDVRHSEARHEPFDRRPDEELAERIYNGDFD